MWPVAARGLQAVLDPGPGSDSAVAREPCCSGTPWRGPGWWHVFDDDINSGLCTCCLTNSRHELIWPECFSEGFLPRVTWIELDQGKGIWGITWLYMWTMTHFSGRSKTKGFLGGPSRRSHRPLIISNPITCFYYFMEKNWDAFSKSGAGRYGSYSYFFRQHLFDEVDGVFVCFGFCLVVLDYFKKKRASNTTDLYFCRFKCILFMF